MYYFPCTYLEHMVPANKDIWLWEHFFQSIDFAHVFVNHEASLREK